MNRYLLAAVVFTMSTVPAFAHHPLGGMPMETLTDGLLSGVGHPLLGFDHLFFVIAVGILALYTSRAQLASAAYIGAMLLGCLLMSFGVGLPVKELVIGISLLVVGGILLSGRATGFAPAVGLFAVFGLFHGSAFGDAIAAQEAGAGVAVLAGYLVGLGLLQYGLALLAGLVVLNMLKATEAKHIHARFAGAVVAGVGTFLTLENIEGLVFNMLGLAV
ncbi:MAG: HupE/UreJ family protein [Desulfurellaceae bacterium]|nr:HupE/UreJ family protein [Desulfurellaceae bacterium]